MFAVFHVVSEQVAHRHTSWFHVWLPFALWVLDYYQVGAPSDWARRPLVRTTTHVRVSPPPSTLNRRSSRCS